MDCNHVVKVAKAMQFWDAYRAIGLAWEACHVPPQRSGHYVRWVQEFVGFQPEIKLKDRSADDIQRFLKFQGEQAGAADWQVKQAAYALRLLYEEFLPEYHPGASAGPKTPKAKFRAQVLPGEADRLQGGVLQELRTALRARHYSYKTETNYLEWARRFLAFHSYKDPRALAPAIALKEYLGFISAWSRNSGSNRQTQTILTG